MCNWISTLAIAATLFSATGAHAQGAPAADRPTIVLVHGAFAESASWDGVITRLQSKGYGVVAVANPLRGVATDAATLSSILRSIAGPVVLVGHSYGGAVISAAAVDHPHVTALVYVAGFAPDAGETSLGLSGQFPGSTLAGTLAAPVPLGDGTSDLYIRQERFHAQFAADVPVASARLMAASQRPVAQEALAEASPKPAWKTIPSWFVYGSDDRHIPAAAHAFMAARAESKRTVVVAGASHVVMISHPVPVVALIEAAVKANGRCLNLTGDKR